MISITGLHKADVLAALYNASHPLGLGKLLYIPQAMTFEEAEAHLAQQTYFDYLNGRVMKLDLSSDTEFEERLYDRDNGSGKALKVITLLRQRLSS